MANAYAELNIAKDTNEIEKLIYSINSFRTGAQLLFFRASKPNHRVKDILRRLRKAF